MLRGSRGDDDASPPTIGKESRTARLRIEVANADGKLRADMAATVEIASPIGSRLAVPESAVIDSGRRQVVLVDRGEGRCPTSLFGKV